MSIPLHVFNSAAKRQNRLNENCLLLSDDAITHARTVGANLRERLDQSTVDHSHDLCMLSRPGTTIGCGMLRSRDCHVPGRHRENTRE